MVRRLQQVLGWMKIGLTLNFNMFCFGLLLYSLCWISEKMVSIKDFVFSIWLLFDCFSLKSQKADEWTSTYQLSVVGLPKLTDGHRPKNVHISPGRMFSEKVVFPGWGGDKNQNSSSWFTPWSSYLGPCILQQQEIKCVLVNVSFFFFFYPYTGNQ